MYTLIIVAVVGVLAMLSEILNFRKYIYSIVIVGLLVALGVNMNYGLTIDKGAEISFGMMRYDTYAIWFSGLIVALLIIWLLVTRSVYKTKFNDSDHYALILFASVGGIVLSSFYNLTMLFIGIEILSIPMYILAGSDKQNLRSNEASLKYFMLGAFMTGILLFGITLIYGYTGTFHMDEIRAIIENSGTTSLFLAGVLLVVIALCFKVSAFPFHFWAPDVYDGAPDSITAFMATVVKTAAFAGFFRLMFFILPAIGPWVTWYYVFGTIVVLTILVGNILAVYQTRVKRMLAYSGVAQAGYLLITLLILTEPQTEGAQTALLFYAASYSLATLAAFGVLILVKKAKGDDTFEAFNSLGRTDPALALVMTISMLSLAGIPPAVGFFAKFYLFTEALQAGFIGVVIVAVIGSLISIYYYFKLIIAMYGKETDQVKVNPGGSFTGLLVAISILIIILGITPNFLLNYL